MKENAGVVKKVNIEGYKPKERIEFKRIDVNPDYCKMGDKFIFKNVKYTKRWKKRIQILLKEIHSIPEYYEYFLGQSSNMESFVVGIHRDEKEKDFVFFSDDYDAQYRKVTDLNSPNFGLENLRVEKRRIQPYKTRDIRIKGNGQVVYNMTRDIRIKGNKQVVYIYSEENFSTGIQRLKESVEIVRADEEQAYNIYQMIYGKENDDKKMYEGIPEEYKKGYYIYQKVDDEEGRLSSVYEHYPEKVKTAARIKIRNKVGTTISFGFNPDKKEYEVYSGKHSLSDVAKWVNGSGCPKLRKAILGMFKERDAAMPPEIKYIFDELDKYTQPTERVQ